MITRRFLMAVALLLFAQNAFAQFGQQPSNRLLDMAARLSREASDFAASNYRTYSSSFRSNRSDIEAIMLSEQLSAATRVFYKMVNDRRRTQDLREGYSFVQNLARSVERNNLQRSNWYSLQRLIADVAREIDSPDSGEGYPDQGRGGRMTWKGKVDDDVRIVIRGGRADVQTIGGTAYYDGQPNFSSSLPARRVNVKLNVRRGRGQVYLEQQPSRENDYSVVVRIKDPKGGASDYEFELTW